jgi:hypothetical protein
LKKFRENIRAYYPKKEKRSSCFVFRCSMWGESAWIQAV